MGQEGQLPTSPPPRPRPLANARPTGVQFVEKLAQATETYLAKLNAVNVPESEQVFWDYVIEQEAAQVEALALAAQGKYRLAAMRLRAFMEQANYQLP